VALYVAWAVQTGLLEALHDMGDATLAQVAARTPLSEAGADALLGVLCSVALTVQQPDGSYGLATAARQYFLRGSPFFVGDQLYAPRQRIPRQYLGRRAGLTTRLATKLRLNLTPTLRFGTIRRLNNQHARNFAPCIAAAQLAEVAEVGCIVDLAGGSGTFAIPVAQRYPDVRIVLAELPQALKNVRRHLAKYGLDERIELKGMNVFARPWDIPPCDAIFIGNFLHAFGDETCLTLCREAHERLQPGGRLWVHEMIWNPRREGPLITALWNATMRLGGGRQRTGEELCELAVRAGFTAPRVTSTAAAYALISARKT
jgi:hypothetical protein